MKNSIYLKLLGLSLCLFLLISCENSLEIEAPNSMIVSDQVFSNDATAKSALQGIYNQLYVANFSAGWLGSVSVLSGLSSDIVEPIKTNSYELMQFDKHQLQTTNTYNDGLWSSAYNIIYLTNSLLEGVHESTQISAEVAKRLEGEAKFIRAFTYFYLVNLYGEVPLVLSTDYKINAVIKKSPKDVVYQQIIADLKTASALLDANYMEGERTHVNHYVAVALLARVSLYRENWGLAASYSSEVIAQSALYTLLPDLDQVFLANSLEAIWQLSPIGSGTGATNTNEGDVFIVNPSYPESSLLKLSEEFVNDLLSVDKRRSHWVGYNDGIEVYYAFKYKIRNSMEIVTEYSMVMRLAEQYLIRAEARAHQNNMSGAIADLNKIRERAGLELLADVNPGITKEALLQKIAIARKRELFTEWGHRWLDLKRTDRAQEILSTQAPGGQSTDKLYPIPEDELLSNPNLTQNPGY